MMDLLSSSEIASRLREIFIDKFMSDTYKTQFLWCKKRVAEENVKPAEIYRNTDIQVGVFIEISSKLLSSKQDIENLVLIADPWVIYGFNYFCKAAIKALDEQGDDVHYKAPKNDKDFFTKFASFTMESDALPSRV